MGRGDKRSFKGKVFRHSYGKTRPRKKVKQAAATPATSAQQQQQRRK